MQEVKIPFLRAFKTYVYGVGEEISIKLYDIFRSKYQLTPLSLYASTDKYLVSGLWQIQGIISHQERNFNFFTYSFILSKMVR